MNEKKLYKVTITDNNGKVVHEVESDCIIAAISDPSITTEEKTGTHGVYMTECDGQTIVNTFKAFEVLKKRLLQKILCSALRWQWKAFRVYSEWVIFAM